MWSVARQLFVNFSLRIKRSGTEFVSYRLFIFEAFGAVVIVPSYSEWGSKLVKNEVVSCNLIKRLIFFLLLSSDITIVLRIEETKRV